MGLLSGLFSASDEVAKGADETAAISDEFVSNTDSVARFGDEPVGGTNPSFSDDPFHKRVAADFTGRVADGSSPAAIADEATGNVATAGKFIGGGAATGAGLFAASQFYDDYSALKTAESKEATYEEYIKALQKIRNDDSLSPEQKEAAIQRLKEAYQQAIANPGNDGSQGTVTDTFEALFGGMGMVDKLLVGIALVALVKAAQEAL